MGISINLTLSTSRFYCFLNKHTTLCCFILILCILYLSYHIFEVLWDCKSRLLLFIHRWNELLPHPYQIASPLQRTLLPPCSCFSYSTILSYPAHEPTRRFQYWAHLSPSCQWLSLLIYPLHLVWFWSNLFPYWKSTKQKKG